MIRGYHAATGETLWELPYPPQGASYSCGTAAVLHIGNEPVLVTVHGWVVRVRDGHKVGDLQIRNMGSESGGASMVSDGEGCVYFLCQDTTIARVKLHAAADGTVTGETLFRKPIKGFNGPTPIAHGGYLYVSGKGILVVDVASGEVVQTVDAKSDKPSPTIAGDRLSMQTPCLRAARRFARRSAGR